MDMTEMAEEITTETAELSEQITTDFSKTNTPTNNPKTKTKTNKIKQTDKIEKADNIDKPVPEKRKVGRPKGSKNAPRRPPTLSTALVEASDSDSIETPPRKCRRVHRKSRTRVIVLSSSSDASDREDKPIRVVRKPARPKPESDSDDTVDKTMDKSLSTTTKSSESLSTSGINRAPQDQRLVQPNRNTKNDKMELNIRDEHQKRFDATKATYDSFFTHLR